MEPEGGEEFDFESPLSHSDQMYIALHEDFQSAQRAGFSHEQAFDLTRILFTTRINFGYAQAAAEEEQ